ncbi:MAG: alpha/beta hydrolase-fold protein, partial [Verrucomicrobiae bacterium]|nr:alpha/beta hydrolase-fold protein [Verrucomicrobiae bacterium]
GAALFLGGCHRDAAPFLDHPRVADGVRMQDVRFYSAALKREMPYRVFLPASIAAGVKLPAIYLLHGGGGNYRDWSNYSDVAKYASAGGGMILVMPEGESSYWVNAALKPEDRFADYLTNDLIADVEARFPAAKGRGNRAIVGVSMGGYAAVELALTRPDLFGFAGAISPAIDVPSRKFSWKRWGQWQRFKTIFGDWGSETRKAGDPFVEVGSADPAKTPYLYLTAGEQEALLEPNKRFVGRLKARGFAYEFHTKPGGHDWGEWDTQIPGCFAELMGRLKAAH